MNVRIVIKESNIINDLLYISKIDINKKKIDQKRNYYIDYSGEKYKDRLFSITKKILND